MPVPSIAERIANWYRGKYIPPPADDPDSLIVIISPGHYEQPFLARLIGAVWGFYARHWQWVWSTIIGVVALYLAALALKKPV
jgi:hypothetical protein